MKQKENSLLPVIILLAVVLLGMTTLAVISISEEKTDYTDVEVPEPPNLYSSSRHVVGTGNRLGTYYPTGKILSEYLNSRLDSNGGSFQAFETNGSIDNINLLQSKRIQFGMVEARVAKEAYLKNPNIRVIWPLWLDVVQLLRPSEVVMPNYVFPSKIKGFIGQKKSSTARTSEEIFSALNIKGRHRVDIPNNLVLKTLSDGRLGFAMIQAGIPNKTVSDAIIFNHCGLVSFNDKERNAMIEKVSSAVPYTIPAGYYADSQPEINTIGLPNLLVTTTEISPDLVEYVTDMIAEGCPRLKGRFKIFETVPTGSDEVLKILHDTGIPLHGGTKHWFEKKGKVMKREDDHKQ